MIPRWREQYAVSNEGCLDRVFDDSLSVKPIIRGEKGCSGFLGSGERSLVTLDEGSVLKYKGCNPRPKTYSNARITHGDEGLTRSLFKSRWGVMSENDLGLSVGGCEAFGGRVKPVASIKYGSDSYCLVLEQPTDLRVDELFDMRVVWDGYGRVDSFLKEERISGLGLSWVKQDFVDLLSEELLSFHSQGLFLGGYASHLGNWLFLDGDVIPCDFDSWFRLSEEDVSEVSDCFKDLCACEALSLGSSGFLLDPDKRMLSLGSDGGVQGFGYGCTHDLYLDDFTNAYRQRFEDLTGVGMNSRYLKRIYEKMWC